MFSGFSKETIEYLTLLGQNNNKAWFEEHREEYSQYVQEPFKALVAELGPYMLEINPYLDLRPSKCISRIYRDIRFSKNKAPYRNNMWISFKRPDRDWKAEPTYYFELFPDGYRYGMGFYDMPKEILYLFREKIEQKDKAFMKMVKAYEAQKEFRLEGERYKRILNQQISEELREWYQRKDLYFIAEKPVDELLFSPMLVDELRNAFMLMKPIYDYFSLLASGGQSSREGILR